MNRLTTPQVGRQARLKKMIKCMKKPFHKQAPSPRHASHLRHLHMWIRSPSKTAYSPPFRIVIPNWQLMITIHPQDPVRTITFCHSMNQPQSSAAKVRMHERAHHLRRLLDSSAIIQEDPSPPKIRFTQSWAKHRDSSIVSIYSSPIASLSTVQINTRLLFSDSSKRRFLLDEAL